MGLQAGSAIRQGGDEAETGIKYHDRHPDQEHRVPGRIGDHYPGPPSGPWPDNRDRMVDRLQGEPCNLF
jgi:hypothetical protein